jgi:multicomponent Na+:H+ antiporter subunit C
MELLWCVVIAVLMSAGIYLMLERHLIRFLFGMLIVSNTINLAIFVAGRLTLGMPPLIKLKEVLPAIGTANPLPQALILTAIVIGFGLLLFTLLLSYRAIKTFSTADMDAIQENERPSKKNTSV